nr:dynein light chain roadblock-type 2-like [Podarcis muralis]
MHSTWEKSIVDLLIGPGRAQGSDGEDTVGDVAEVEETLKRIQSHKGVIGAIVVNAEGIPVRTTLDNSTTVQYAGLLHQLMMKAKSTVRDIDPQTDLTFLGIRSKNHEIMVAPDKESLLIVIQNPRE